MSHLTINLLGRVRIRREDDEGRVIDLSMTHVTQMLLAYLLLNRQRAHSRDVLAGMFWGDYPDEHARNSLSTALWRLRQVIEPRKARQGIYLRCTSQGEIGFNNTSDHWLDVAEFETSLLPILSKPFQNVSHEDVRRLEAGINLYVGDLMEGCSDEWLLFERERMKSICLNGLGLLMRYHTREEDFDKGLAYGDRILRMDPLREEVHREMMRMYFITGQRAMAVRQYELCRAVLQRELDLAPMEETQQLHDRIVSAQSPPRSDLNASMLPPASSNRHMLESMLASLQALQHAQDWIQQSIQQLSVAIQHAPVMKDDSQALR